MRRIEIDLFSDTVTTPSPAMRQAMAEAEVGDDQLGEDPTTTALEHVVARLLGMPAAVFMPSGHMCNVAAQGVHCRPGDEVYLHETAHPIHYEAGASAALTGVQLRPLAGEAGTFGPATLRDALRPAADVHQPRSRLVIVEQTANAAGGRIWPLARLRLVRDMAREHGLAVHMDGARLLEAVVADGTAPRDWCSELDSAWIDLSKGLGCPAGAVLCGSNEFVAEARRWRQRLGGSLRQSGILAAAGLHALEHHVDELADHHASALAFAEIAHESSALRVDPADVETNIVIVDVAGTGMEAGEFLRTLRERHGVRLSPMGGSLVRAVTHRDVTREQVEQAARHVVEVAGTR